METLTSKKKRNKYIKKNSQTSDLSSVHDGRLLQHDGQSFRGRCQLVRVLEAHAGVPPADTRSHDWMRCRRVGELSGCVSPVHYVAGSQQGGGVDHRVPHGAGSVHLRELAHKMARQETAMRATNCSQALAVKGVVRF